MFRDRVEAGRLLAEAVLRSVRKDPVVLALPRGGVPVAAEVARALDAPLDLLLVRKIGAPGNPELAIGAVAESSPVMRSVSTRTGGPSSMLNVTRTLPSAFGATVVSTAAE